MELTEFSNYRFNIQAIPLLIVGFSMIACGIFVYKQNTQSTTNRKFLYICLSVFFWLLPTALGYFSSNENVAKIWFKIDNFSVLFISINVYLFIKAFLGREVSRTDKLGYICLTSFGIIAFFSNNLVVGVYKYFWGYFPKWGILGLALLTIFFGYMIAAFYLLLRNYSSIESTLKKNQAKYIFMGFLFAYTGSVDFLATYGFQIYPFGFISITCFLFIIGFAIVKHGLMDIEVVIKRTAVFAGLFAFVYGVFSIATIVGQEVFKKYFGWNEWLSTIPTVLIITFALRPLEIYLTNVTERFLFQKKFDYRELLRTFTNEVLTVLELQKLTEQTINGLTRIIKLESAAILLFDKDAKIYKLAASSGVKVKDLQFKEQDTLISYLIQTHHPILKDRDADQMEGHSHLREDFKKLNAQLCLPIAHHDQLIGVLTLGMKKSGEDYTPEDIDILTTLSRTLGIAIANAQLFDQLSKTQAEAAQREKMAVIGTLAAGINHEICNPLGIVRGQCEMFLLNLRDGLYGDKDKEDMIQIATDIMNKVIKETDRATGITKRLSGFAKPAKKFENEEVFVEKETDEVISLLGHDLKLNNIAFSKNFGPDFPAISADKRQVQEILFNIIRNAAQAMDKKSGKIDLTGFTVNGSVIIKIADNGSGIPLDKIGQIFNPFFTTKEPGKGTGLGLFIVRQVIERNRGTIVVESQEGEGTTFTLTFPKAEPAHLVA